MARDSQTCALQLIALKLETMRELHKIRLIYGLAAVKCLDMSVYGHDQFSTLSLENCSAPEYIFRIIHSLFLHLPPI